ncbi:hypothetical protein [Streptomyces atriruber]|uniref:hypothetical protein n=1 Tax=Streptomyces atriruber TaxID=545121 RepID=UPI0006E41578|nr:hypothetical protein [Streptomyces atriruber]
MNVLIVVAILALFGLGFSQPLLWLAAAALIFYLARFYEGGSSAKNSGSGSSSGSGSASSGGGMGGGGGGGGSYPKTYRDYRIRKERMERWDRRYRRTHPGSR